MECANYKTCGERTEMFCSICNMFICDSCDPSHTSTIFTQHHKRSKTNTNILFGGGDGDELLGLEKMKKKECSKHPSEVISGYCFGCCTLVCIHCVLETHGEHKEKVKAIEESVLKKRGRSCKDWRSIGEKIECD